MKPSQLNKHNPPFDHISLPEHVSGKLDILLPLLPENVPFGHLQQSLLPISHLNYLSSPLWVKYFLSFAFRYLLLQLTLRRHLEHILLRRRVVKSHFVLQNKVWLFLYPIQFRGILLDQQRVILPHVLIQLVINFKNHVLLCPWGQILYVYLLLLGRHFFLEFCHFFLHLLLLLENWFDQLVLDVKAAFFVSGLECQVNFIRVLFGVSGLLRPEGDGIFLRFVHRVDRLLVYVLLVVGLWRVCAILWDKNLKVIWQLLIERLILFIHPFREYLKLQR